MKKILISTNQKLADSEIQAFENKAKLMTQSIIEYNSSGLTPLTAQTALDFLKAPKPYLDEQIVLQSGLKVQNVVPEKLADLIGVPYKQILKFVTHWDVNDFLIDEKLVVSLSREKKEAIIESHKFYIETDEQINAYRDLQKVCEMLNAHAEAYGVDNFDRNHLSRFLKLETEKNEAGKYQFIPNLKVFKIMIAKNLNNSN